MKRNNTIDILRGFAILLVVLGHTMSGSATGSEKSVMFNAIWSLQMPLFMLISGYVVKYSRFPNNCRELFGIIKRKTLNYLVPWAVCTLLLRGVLLGNWKWFNPGYVVWHMDSGYWFLFSLWCIVCLYQLAMYMSSHIFKRRDNEVTRGGVYVLAMLMLAIPGVLIGINFLCIKLTLYYMPFYYLGAWYGKCGERIVQKIIKPNFQRVLVVLVLAIWIAIMFTWNTYEHEDDLLGITVRLVASVLGCAGISALIGRFEWHFEKNNCLVWIGKHTLEIYTLHYLFLNLIPFPAYTYTDVMGKISIIANYTLTLLMTCTATLLLEKIALIRKMLWMK